MRKSEYIRFEERESPSTKTRVIAVASVSSGIELGHIAWYTSWRQYVFHPAQGTVFNPDCLDTISERTKQLTADHRRMMQERRRRA